MTGLSEDAVSTALRSIDLVSHYTLQQWEALIRQARPANVLSRIALSVADAGLMDRVPAAPRAHLQAAITVAHAQAEAVRQEVAHIERALAPLATDVILLKGAAYFMAELPAARGRVFSDVDILVPRDALPQVEAELMLNGWATTHLHAYDQRYYRRWMHELPPMLHVTRNTVLDVHHAILPATARLRPDSRKLIAASRALESAPGLRVLAPVDMILHSATHLFYNEDLSSGLRDIADLDSLMRGFSAAPEFWRELTERAAELDLTRPLFYALRYSARMMDTPVAPSALRALASAAPPSWVVSMMDSIYMRALRPHHSLAEDALTPFARRALYVRAHWLRMPPHLLALHLSVKALRREEADP